MSNSACPVDRDPPVDARGVRFAAAVTTAVLALVLVSGSGLLLAAQGAVFALGAFAGLRFAPYSVLYRRFVAPRLGPVTEREGSAPVRFSQGVGLVFAAVGAVGYLAGAPLVGIVATAFALVAAALNAAVGLCIGCRMYGLLHPLITRTHRRIDRQGATA
ncbi:DUF4395 domain-containing protein [Pseudonocardia sp.]|uniref:DUF4395 domain-containing protein n=1 Tax=Pseudonocardia sp. TaxID=60912 RepID=UPI003D0BF3FF